MRVTAAQISVTPPSPAAPLGNAFRVTAVRPAAPTANIAEAREEARAQIMAERGVDRLALFRSSPQDRIQAERAIMVETVQRTRPAPRGDTGNLIDIRV